METEIIYALKDKKYFQFTCISKTKRELEDKIETAYWDWKSSRSRSELEETKTKQVFLSNYIKVKITVDRL